MPAAEYTSDNPFVQGYEWLSTSANWQGTSGIPHRILEHMGYTGLTVLIAVAIAVPLGLYVGHTGRGRVVVVALAGILRALPTLGVMTLFVLMATSTLSLMPPVWALVLLAVPPIMAGSYAGISSVRPDIVDAARSMGMTELQVLFRVEVPNALPVMLGGLRAGVLQVLASVAVVALVGLGGLGRYIIDGLAAQDYGEVLGGAMIIAALAVVVDGILAGLQRLAVSPGLKDTRRTPVHTTTGAENLVATVQGEAP